MFGVYFKKAITPMIYLLLYVYNMLLVCKDIYEINKLKSQLKERFMLKDLRHAKRIVEMEITRNKKISLMLYTI